METGIQNLDLFEEKVLSGGTDLGDLLDSLLVFIVELVSEVQHFVVGLFFQLSDLSSEARNELV